MIATKFFLEQSGGTTANAIKELLITDLKVRRNLNLPTTNNS
jgi:hypothetical protein